MKDTQQTVTIRFANGIELVDVSLETVKQIAETLDLLAKLPPPAPMQVIPCPVPYPVPAPWYVPPPNPYFDPWRPTLVSSNTTRLFVDKDGELK